MYILAKLSSLVLAGAVSLGIVSAPVQPLAPVDYSAKIAALEQKIDDLQTKQVPSGASFGAIVPSTPALYDGYLASNISKTDTSMTVTPGTLRNGQSLSGYMCFVIDVNQPTVEYVCGTAVGTSITGISRGIDVLTPTTTSATLTSTHRRFASVSVADYPTIQLLVQKVNGQDSLDRIIRYTSNLTFASTSDIVTKKYVDDTAFSGAAVIDATTNARGVGQLATTLQTASSTATGSSGALLIPASNATSTYNSATAALRVVVTQNSGKIDNNFINFSAFTGAFSAATTTFTGPVSLSGSSATSTIASSSIAVYLATTTSSNGGYTWTKPSNLKFLLVEEVGGGGGGDDDGSGAGGGYCRMIVPAAAIPSTVAISVGHAGAGDTGTSGATGGTTTFGSVGCTANGGANNTTGGTATGGDLNIQGGDGGVPFQTDSATARTICQGGGGSVFGSRGTLTGDSGGNCAGNASRGYGGGGGGSAGTAGGSDGITGAIVITSVFY